jgi:uncharacterized OB-fold protein
VSTPIADGLLVQHDDGTIDLVGGYSPTSDAFHFPQLPTCPYTGATDVEARTLKRDATLWAWTAVTAPPPGYEGEVPYGFGVVELTAERLRIVTRLTEADPARLTFGQPMTLIAETLPGDVVTWAFAPATEADAK